MKKLLLLILIPGLLFFSSCSHRRVRVNEKERTITVTGSADATLTPDEVTMTINIGEYYKEQFDPNIKPKDYKTLVKLDEIEKPIMDLLKKNGIADSCIHFSMMNTSWSWYSADYYGDYTNADKKPVHLEKTLSIKFRDFDKAVEIVQTIDTKGVESMTLGDFKSSKEQQMRKDLKAQALKNAQDKASNMLKQINHELGDVVSITEKDDANSYWSWQPSQTSNSNVTYNSSSAAPAGSPQDIKMRYEVEAEFEIE
ncbi:MAG: SIMPL domain-containing protein [Bacteroidetes bacterium]|nr:SIMPL domain-containing protein [Bacteroidota bacterium]